jgi:four helix bundle protein
MNKITTFKDLNVWKEGHLLVLAVYTITKTFPKEEKYGLTDQMRRCAVSITSNVAEGFSRQGKKEKIQFYYTAKGSLTELNNQSIIAKDVGYINNDTFTDVEKQINKVGKILTGLIKSTKKL